MDVFESKAIKIGSVGLYIVLAFLSFYCACYRLPVGLKYGINLVIFAWACAAFFIHPVFERAKFCLRFFALFFFPFMLFWMWSVGIWISEFQTFAYILRGSQNIIYMLTNMLYVCGAVYLFGENTINYTIVGMAIANGLVGLQVAAAEGIGNFISQYIQLMVTFADETGGAMHQMELHDMVYGWGACVIYYAIHKEKHPVLQAIWLGVSTLFFTLGFKRIAVPAVAGAICLYHVLRKLKWKRVKQLATVAAITVGVLVFLYLISIKNHLFFEFCDKYEINLMSRDLLFTYYEDFYELLPTYLGRGVRFIYAYGSERKPNEVLVNAVHNVYLETYIEEGFWCWWIWILYELAFRVHRMDDRYGHILAYATMAMNFYLFFTFLTDNTSFYFPNNVMCRMTIMAWAFEIDKKGPPAPTFSELEKEIEHEKNSVRNPVVW